MKLKCVEWISLYLSLSHHRRSFDDKMLKLHGIHWCSITHYYIYSFAIRVTHIAQSSVPQCMKARSNVSEKERERTSENSRRKNQTWKVINFNYYQKKTKLKRRNQNERWRRWRTKGWMQRALSFTSANSMCARICEEERKDIPVQCRTWTVELWAQLKNAHRRQAVGPFLR